MTFLPNSFLRLIKSGLFAKKHFVPNFFHRDAHLHEEIKSLHSCILFISHSNYLSSMGGTEKIILEQVEALFSTQVDTLCIYPKGASAQLTYCKPCRYGVTLNGYEILELSSSQLLSFFMQVQPKVKEMRIHHLLFWPLADVLEIIQKYIEKKVAIEMYIHDFHFKCPKVNLFCQSGSHRCQQSFYSWIISRWRKTYAKLLRLSNSILSPSVYMQQQVPAEYKSQLYNIADASSPPHKKLKLAYLGAASPIKGYETWIKLSKNALIRRVYDLVHIGSRDAEEQGIPLAHYSYYNSKNCVASELLNEHKIDLVLLWSQVPESYSFTFHEAKKANKFVITSAKSGNIAFSLSTNEGLGVILNSEYELFQFLLKKSL